MPVEASVFLIFIVCMALSVLWSIFSISFHPALRLITGAVLLFAGYVMRAELEDAVGKADVFLAVPVIGIFLSLTMRFPEDWCWWRWK